MDKGAIVVVGAGQAGGWAARTLRAEGYAGRVVLIGEEPYPPYERPPLSKGVLAGTEPPERTFLFKPEQLGGIDFRPRCRASAIDRVARAVFLADGSRIGYDKLILCTGGRARNLDVPGAGLPEVMTLRSLDDALAINGCMRRAKRLAVVGGGWIGLEVAATARAAGLEVTLIEALPRLCQRAVPPQVSEYLQSLHARHGVRLLLARAVDGFAPGRHGGLAVRLHGAADVECDFALVGIGMAANQDLAEAAGVACDSGVLVDEQCRTSDPDILAAGDVARVLERSGASYRLESWQNAQDQGIFAARMALGADLRYRPLPYFWSDQYDVRLQMYGVPAAHHEVVMRKAGEDRFLAFFLDAGCVEAVASANGGREFPVARRLVQQRKAVDRSRLSDPAVALGAG